MLKYAQINSDNICYGISESTHPLSGVGIVPITDDDNPIWRKYADGVWSTETFETKNTRFSKLEFQNRFTFSELVAIETAAETSPGVRVLQRQQLSAEFIDIMDINTQNGIAYLVSQGLLTQERGTAILTP